jgi:hypothetical protein
MKDAPERRARSRIAGSLSEVTNPSFTAFPSALSALRSSMPLISGMLQSASTRAGARSWTAFRASAPLLASTKVTWS